MRTKQSLTASEMYRCSGSVASVLPMPLGVSSDWAGFSRRIPSSSPPSAAHKPSAIRRPRPQQASTQGEGLLHDARNLIGALGLYCDLLSMPGVLKPEHRHYPVELRLLGKRSRALIEHLTGVVLEKGSGDDARRGVSARPRDKDEVAGSGVRRRSQKPVNLRSLVERAAGLLRSVGGGRPVEVSYGAAATMPVWVSGEAVERILVNLVQNAAAALDRRDAAPCAPMRSAEIVEPAPEDDELAIEQERTRGIPAGADPRSVRIGVGLLDNRVGDARPWPFRRVRLTVEDSGCGMAPELLERLLGDNRVATRAGHGIGFRIVQELVAASEGELRIMSAPGVGSCVQIEWPVAAICDPDEDEERADSHLPERRDGASGGQQIGEPTTSSRAGASGTPKARGQRSDESSTMKEESC